MNFNMGDVSWYENDGVLGEYVVDAYICLEHIPRKENEDQWGNPQFDSVTGEAIKKVFSICRLRNNVTLQEEQVVLEDGKVGTGDDVEAIASPSYKMPDDCIDGKIENFLVSPEDDLVCIDVSSMVRNYQPFVAESAQEAKPVESGRLRRRRLRHLNRPRQPAYRDDGGHVLARQGERRDRGALRPLQAHLRAPPADARRAAALQRAVRRLVRERP